MFKGLLQEFHSGNVYITLQFCGLCYISTNGTRYLGCNNLCLVYYFIILLGAVVKDEWRMLRLDSKKVRLPFHSWTGVRFEQHACGDLD